MPRKLLPPRWIVITSVSTTSFVIGGVGSVAVGLLINPLMTAFAWPSALTSSAATAFGSALLLASPAVGIAVDRLGARSIIAFGAVAVSIGFLLVSHCHRSYEMLVGFALVGIGDCAAFYVPSAIVVTDWMSSKRSLGMGIVWSAASIGAALFAMLIGRWIEAYGWRVASELIAAITAMMAPLTLLTIRGRSPRPAYTPTWVAESVQVPKTGRKLLLSPMFMVATTSSALFAIGMIGIYYHLVSLLIEAGYSTHSAGIVLGSSWITSALGSFVLGIGAERLGAKPILASALFACALGTLLLLGAGDARFGVLCAMAFVVLWGASANSVAQFVPVIFADGFGSQSLGVLIGVQSSVMGIAGAAAPIVTGLLYDRFGNYRLAICLSASATLLAFLTALLITVPRQAGSTRQEEMRECH